MKIGGVLSSLISGQPEKVIKQAKNHIEPNQKKKPC